MRWQGRRQSSNVEDRRGMSSGRKVGIGGGIGTIVILIIVMLLGGDPLQVLNMMQDGGQLGYEAEQYTEPVSEQDEMAQFVAVVLADTEDVWHAIFKQRNLRYREPRLVLFRSAVESACGFAQSATGPFYCPGDEKVYIDLDFLEQLQQRLGAEGDFAVAYIIAHEVGHHVQNLFGTLDRNNKAKAGRSQKQKNAMDVKVELQADFYAGIWAHYAQKTKNILEEGDLEEAMNAAQAVGDDRIQKQSQGYVVPDSFTHGTSAQRMKSFMLGFESGDITLGEI
ncbi:MAG: zinc metallopeptidase [Prolixibacteraceae bacterium]|nr:zinc metallopeptidase [Prolixibacteraceae bacterium]